jgi:hypothetical protein
MPQDPNEPQSDELVRSKAETPLAAIMLLAGIAILYAPLAFGQLLYRRDLSQWIYPSQWFLRNAQEQGQSIAWNPFVGMGMSPYANPLYGVFYPLNWLHRIGPLALMTNVVGLLHLIGGAVGMWLLTRKLGVRPLVSSLAALAWALGGFSSSMWTFGIFVAACSYFPWQAWAFVRLFESVGQPRAKVLTRIAMAALMFGLSLLLGELFLALVGFAAGVLVGLAACGSVFRTKRGIGTGIVAIVLVGLLGVGLGAATWWPARAAVASTERAQALPLEIAERGSFVPLRLAELGSSNSTMRLFEANPKLVTQWLGGTQPLALSIYGGASVMGLAILALGLRRRRELVLAGLCLFGFLMAMGSHTPVHKLVRVLVPPLALMRLPEKYLVVPMMVLVVLAALGAERVLRDARLGHSRWKTTLVLLCALIAVDVVAFVLLPTSLRGTFLPGCAHGLVALLALLLLQTQGAKWPRAFAVALPLLIAADTALASRSVLKFDAAEKLSATPPLAKEIWKNHAQTQPGDVPPRLFRSFVVSEVAAMKQLPGEVSPWRPVLTLRDNLGSTFGVSTVPGYDAALAPELDRLFKASRPESMILAGAQFALLPTFPPRTPQEGNLTVLLDPLPGARLYSITNALPHVYAVTDVRIGKDTLTDDGVFHPDVVSGRAATLSADAKLDTPMVAALSDIGRCEVARYLTDHVSLNCELKAAALVVLLEQYTPDWKATVDGVRATVLRTNSLARAVAVGAGKHRVEYQFEAPGVAAGVCVTLAAMLVCVALMLWGRFTPFRNENGGGGP